MSEENIKIQNFQKMCHRENIREMKDTEHSLDPGRVVTDAVHERFSDTYVFCDDCKASIIADHVNISKHFQKTHISIISCLYCKGKVFRYYQLSRDQDIEADEIIFHNCRDWL